MSGLKSGFSRVPKHSRFNYESRYGKEEKGLENRKKTIQIEKGALYSNSQSFSKLREPSISHYKHNTRHRKYMKYTLTLLMLGCILTYYNYGGYPGILALLFLLILLIVFIRLNNKS